MSEDLKRTGQCLCGENKFEVTLKSAEAHVCHCHLCRKWGDTPSISFGIENEITFTQENLKWFQSSEYAQRGFCSACGTHLFFRTTDDTGYQGITAGVLDNQTGFKIDSHIFIDQKADYYDLTGDEPRLTRDEFFKMLEEYKQNGTA